MAADERIWIETADEQEALCVLGALADYEARLRFIGGGYQVHVEAEHVADELLRAIHRAVRNCLDDDGLESVVFHVGHEAYSLRASA
jgi:hypothetical protein